MYLLFCTLIFAAYPTFASTPLPLPRFHPSDQFHPTLIPNCWNSWGWATLLHQLRSQSNCTLCICICMRWNLDFPMEPNKNIFRIEVVSPFPTSLNSWLVTWWATPLRQLRSQSNKCPVNQLIVKKYKRCVRFFEKSHIFYPNSNNCLACHCFVSQFF